MAKRDLIGRAVSAVTRRVRPRPPHTTPSAPAAPLWVRALTSGGRPIVLGVALVMCAPGEYHLARHAGWSDPYAYGMPIVLSAYAGIASAVASIRRPGDRGRWSAILGACIALALAMAAQVVSHWIGTHHLNSDQPWLIAVVSLVPPAVVGHLLHLAATPPTTRTAHTEDGPANARPDAPDTHAAPVLAPPAPRWITAPAGARPLPLVARTTDAQDTTDDDEDAQDDDRPHPSDRRLISTRELADRVGVSPSTVRNWVSGGTLQPAETDTRGRHWFDPTVAVGAALS